MKSHTSNAVSLFPQPNFKFSKMSRHYCYLQMPHVDTFVLGWTRKTDSFDSVITKCIAPNITRASGVLKIMFGIQQSCIPFQHYGISQFHLQAAKDAKEVCKTGLFESVWCWPNLKAHIKCFQRLSMWLFHQVEVYLAQFLETSVC